MGTVLLEVPSLTHFCSNSIFNFRVACFICAGIIFSNPLALPPVSAPPIRVPHTVASPPRRPPTPPEGGPPTPRLAAHAKENLSLPNGPELSLAMPSLVSPSMFLFYNRDVVKNKKDGSKSSQKSRWLSWVSNGSKELTEKRAAW